jgi:hypothetical protein
VGQDLQENPSSQASPKGGAESCRYGNITEEELGSTRTPCTRLNLNDEVEHLEEMKILLYHSRVHSSGRGDCRIARLIQSSDEAQNTLRSSRIH